MFKILIKNLQEKVIFMIIIEAMNSVVQMDPKLIQRFKEDFGEGVTYVPNNGLG
jgi:hypothetical protein